jgi:hypothetical protein
VSHAYAGWSDYDFTATLKEALSSTPKWHDFDEANTVYWRRFNEANGTPTDKELQRHVKLYGRAGTETFLGATEDADGLARNSAEANLKESSRKRSRRRTGIKEQVASLLERNPDLMPAAIADTLNLSDRRVKLILSELDTAA